MLINPELFSPSSTAKIIDKGLILVDSFNPDFEIPDLNNLPFEQKYPSISGLNSYGVVDSIAQFKSLFGLKLEEDCRKFIVTFKEVKREDQPKQGGWRWHKWGPYYGTYDCQHEYLYDEDIEAVYVYTIYEVN